MSGWYIEWYDLDGTKAKRHATLAGVKEITEEVKKVRAAGNVEKLRVTVPADASHEDRAAFVALGVDPF